MKRPLIAATMLLAPLSAQAQEVGEIVSLVSCPVYRDADNGRKSGCWLVRDGGSGHQWDVSQSPHKPNWDYAVFVEGRVADQGEDICGAPVLEPVRTSRLLDRRCPRHMLPAEGYPGRVFIAPDRYLTSLANPPEFEDPFGPRTFYAFFEFDRDFLVYQYSDFIVQQAAYWIEAAQPRRLVVTGYAATDPIEVSGVELAESPEIAQRRAEVVALTLSRLLPGMEIETRWETGSQPIDVPDADTIPGQSQRRVEIAVEF